MSEVLKQKYTNIWMTLEKCFPVSYGPQQFAWIFKVLYDKVHIELSQLCSRRSIIPSVLHVVIGHGSAERCSYVLVVETAQRIVFELAA